MMNAQALAVLPSRFATTMPSNDCKPVIAWPDQIKRRKAMSQSRTTRFRGRVQALVLLEDMAGVGQEVHPDTVTFNTALKACTNANRMDIALEVSLPAACTAGQMPQP